MLMATQKKLNIIDDKPFGYPGSRYAQSHSPAHTHAHTHTRTHTDPRTHTFLVAAEELQLSLLLAAEGGHHGDGQPQCLPGITM